MKATRGTAPSAGTRELRTTGQPRRWRPLAARRPRGMRARRPDLRLRRRRPRAPPGRPVADGPGTPRGSVHPGPAPPRRHGRVRTGRPGTGRVRPDRVRPGRAEPGSRVRVRVALSPAPRAGPRRRCPVGRLRSLPLPGRQASSAPVPTLRRSRASSVPSPRRRRSPAPRLVPVLARLQDRTPGPPRGRCPHPPQRVPRGLRARGNQRLPRWRRRPPRTPPPVLPRPRSRSGDG